MIWIIADTHFGHGNIIKYCKRPFKNVKDMDEYIIKEWNKRVHENDLVVHLGDFTFRNVNYYKRRLKGTILLIIGNHDRDPFILRRNGFITARYPLKIGHYILSHYPEKNFSEFYTNIHGHIHQRDTWGKRINLSVEKTAYKPIPFWPFGKFNKIKSFFGGKFKDWGKFNSISDARRYALELANPYPKTRTKIWCSRWDSNPQN